MGTLRDFWKNNSPLFELDPGYLQWVFTQLCGLASAITTLHYLGSGDHSFRHGDIKPDNVLCFEERGSEGLLQGNRCHLVIGNTDAWLTNLPYVSIELRVQATTTGASTTMYEAPEAFFTTQAPRSRRFDIWSISCVYMEMIIWLLYGNEELERFAHELGNTPRFYSFDNSGRTSTGTPRIHPTVQMWAEWIMNDPRCAGQTAVRLLVQLIMDRFLVVELGTMQEFPPTSSMVHHSGPDGIASPTIIRTSEKSGSFEGAPELEPGYRADAKEMGREMRRLLDDAERGTISWLNFEQPHQSGPKTFREHLSVSDAALTRVLSTKEKEVCQIMHGSSDMY